jgi:hypothetical protein
MLSLDAPIGPIHGVLVFKDTGDPDLHYYVPQRPRLARNDGVPELVFMIFQRDITDNPAFDADTKQALGGGFVTFTVDLSVDDAVLDAVKEDLRRFGSGGDVKLTPIQFRKGTVRLSITKDIAGQPDAPPEQPKGFQLFEEIYGTSKPSLLGDNRATFSVLLGQEAATLFEAALRTGMSPIGVIYDLEYLGMRPAFNVRITADYERIYSELDVQFGLKGGYGPIAAAIEVDLAFQRLRDKGDIKVEVINFTDDDNFRKQADDAFNWFKTDLIKDFFKSALDPPAFMKPASSAGGGVVGQLAGLLGNLMQTQSGTATPERGAPTTEAPTPGSPAKNQDSNVVTTSEAHTPPADGTPGGGGKASPGFGIQFGLTLKFLSQEERKTRTFEYSMQAAVAREAAPQGSFSTMVSGLDLNRAIKRVSLDDDFFKRLISTVSVGADLTKGDISSVTVNLEYPGTRAPGEEPAHVDGFTFRAGDVDPKTFTCFLDEKKRMDYRYKMDVNFAPDSEWIGNEPHVSSDWIVTRDRQLTLNPFDVVDLFDLEITLGKLDADIEQVQIELDYTDEAAGFSAQRTFMLNPGAPSTHWKLRFGETTQKQFRYRLTFFLTGNVRYETDWLASQAVTVEEAGLVITSPFKGAIEVRLVPLLAPAEIVEANVDLLYKEADTGYERREHATFSGTGFGASSPTTNKFDSVLLTIPTLAENPTGFTYDLVIVRSDGSVFESDSQPLTADTRVVPVSDGIGKTHRIRVQLPDKNFSASGLAAVRVRVRGNGDDPDSSEALFTASSTDDRAVVLVQPDGTGGPFSYHWEVEGYSQAGLPVPGRSGDSADPTLVVPLPGR